MSPVVFLSKEMVIWIDQGSYLLLPIILDIKEYEKYSFYCESWNFLNPFPKINRFVAWWAKQTIVVAFALVSHPYYIMGGVVHPGNNPKKIQMIQAVHKLWRPPLSCHSRTWIFATASSQFMSFRCRKVQTDPQIRVRQLPLTRTTMTETIVLVRRLPRSQRSHYHKLIRQARRLLSLHIHAHSQTSSRDPAATIQWRFCRCAIISSLEGSNPSSLDMLILINYVTMLWLVRLQDIDGYGLNCLIYVCPQIVCVGQ